MGCGSGQKDVTAPIRISTVTGKLKVTVTTAHITHQVSVFKMDPYLILRLSNQTFTSKIVEKGDKDPTFFQSFTFYVNSCYKVHGRNLQVTLMDKKKVKADEQIGFGIVDLDPVINFKKPKDEFRCFINYDRKQAGFVNIIAQFQQQTAQTVSFRFQTASIRRKTSTFGDMNCWVKASIGEETLETSRQKDTKQMPPVWAKEILTFNVPKSAQHCQVIVMDDDTEVGRVLVPLDKIVTSNSEQSFNEQFSFGKDDKQVNAGSIKFQTLTGVNPSFSQVKTNHSKPKQVPKKQQQPKKQQPKKQEPKKQQPKKQEPKKQQPKKEEPKKEQPKKEEPKISA